MKPQAIKTFFTKLIEHFSACMNPVIPVLLSGGIIKLLVLILNMTGLGSGLGHAVAILSVISDALFYFLPIFVAYASAQHFGVNPLHAIAAVCAMLLPDFIELMEAEEAIHFIVFPVAKVTYAYMVIPIILLVYVLFLLDKLFRRAMPEGLHSILLPVCNILATALIGIIIVGPVGDWASNALSIGIYALYEISPVVACSVLSFFMPVLIIAGVHWVFVAIAITTMAAGGTDPICMQACLNMSLALFGSTTALFLRTKNPDTKKTCATAATSLFFTGVSEPALYGVCLPERKALLTTMIGAGIGGLFSGYTAVKCFVYAYPTWLAILMFSDSANPRNMLNAFIASVIALVSAFVLAFLCYSTKTADSKGKEDAKLPSAVKSA